MKIGHCCAEPFPVVTMVTVSAARACGRPAATETDTSDASIPVTRSNARLLTAFLPMRSSGSCRGRAGQRRRQERQHLPGERFQPREHGVEMQQEQLHPDLLI